VESPVTFLLIAVVVSIALDVVEYVSIRQQEREWHENVGFYAAQREADRRRYVDSDVMR
jgi:hypothetical protein